MDPISILFAAYLDTVTNSIHSHMTDIMGTELQPVVIIYEGVDVPFQHQMWRLREPSVCASYEQRMGEFSDCTVKAKALFNDLCTELSKNPKQHWRYVKTKNMYCNAAISFQPTVAEISGASEPNAAQLARQRCNLAVSAAMDSSDRKVITERKEACEEYERLK